MEEKLEKYTKAEQHKEKRIFKNKESLRNLWDNMKHNNIQIMGIPEGEKSEQGLENLFEGIMTENFPSVVRKKTHKSGSSESLKINLMDRNKHKQAVKMGRQRTRPQMKV